MNVTPISDYERYKQMAKGHEKALAPVPGGHPGPQRDCGYCREKAELAVNCYVEALTLAPFEHCRELVASRIATLYEHILGE